MSATTTLAGIWAHLALQDYHQQIDRKKTRIVWWPRENIFPARTWSPGKIVQTLTRKHPDGKELRAAVKRFDACTLPWAPPMETIDAADNAMFTEGDKFDTDMQLRRDILIDVLHSVPADITPRDIKALMYQRFQSLLPAMTAKAGTTKYEDFIAGGWSRAQLIEHGYVVKAES